MTFGWANGTTANGDRASPGTAIHNVPVADVQADEIWGYVGCHEKVRQAKRCDESRGDAYCFTAIK